MTLDLHPLFSDHAVLQRDKPLGVWGHAAPGTTVEITLAGRSATVRSDADGRWHATLDALPAGGPHELAVRSDGISIRRSDLLIGDVWLCSGQSNMEWTLRQIEDADAARNATHEQIRLLTVPRDPTETPSRDFAATWSRCTPETAIDFSAVAYFMGVDLHRALGVPIGLINSSYGGTTAESWVSEEALRSEPSLEAIVARLPANAASDVNAPWDDPGDDGVALGYADPAHDDSTWSDMAVPQAWERAGLAIDGAVWFRHAVDLPADAAGRPLRLCLSTIDDFDVTYVNGVRVGATDRQTRQWWASPREYAIPAGVARPGRNVIAVRVFDQWGSGGFTGKGADMRLAWPGGAVPLAGRWKYKVAVELPERSAMMSIRPARLFNGMIHPLLPLSLRGFAWYQGESNAERGRQYRTLLRTLIRDWRRRFGQGELPFLVVQLPNYMRRAATPGESHWAELREAQQDAATLPTVGLAVTLDVGDADDIHPRHKRPVGARLAREALRLAFGRDLAGSPRVTELQWTDGAARVRFNHGGAGLRTTDGAPPRGFALAGEDRRWRFADAAIVAPDVVEVRCAEIPAPTALRYAWADNPDVNLVNSDGLPAAPFRSDDFPMLSAENA